MPFIQFISNLAKAFNARSAIGHTLFLTLAMLTFEVQALSPSQVFDKVKESVVVVRTLDAKGRIIGQGSGVLLPSGKIGTNCHVVKNGGSFQVGGGKQFVMAIVWGSDEDKDICLLEAKGLAAKPAQLGQAMRLKVGEPVYAVGAPRGLELSLSDGIVSQLRGGPPPFIQTTASISPGSSGGGLFDAEGRLVGFTTLYIEGGQNLNFAMPVEWAREILPGKKVAQGRSEVDWIKRVDALQSAKNWTAMMYWCQEWTKAQPENGLAWFNLSVAYETLERYTEAIDANRQVIRINPGNRHAWLGIGMAYTRLQRYTEAIDPLRQAIRIDPLDNASGFLRIAWGLLGTAYGASQRYTEAIDACRQAMRIDPGVGACWFVLGAAYHGLQRYTEAIDPLRQAVRIDPEDVNAWGLLAISYEVSGNRTAALGAVSQLRRIDPAKANELFKLMGPQPVESSHAVSRWIRVGRNEIGIVYADPGTIRRAGDKVKMWDMFDLHKVGIVADKSYLSNTAQSEYDCKEEKKRFIAFTHYSGNMGRGEVVFNLSDDAFKWTPIAPGTSDHILWKFACGKG